MEANEDIHVMLCYTNGIRLAGVKICSSSLVSETRNHTYETEHMSYSLSGI